MAVWANNNAVHLRREGFRFAICDDSHAPRALPCLLNPNTDGAGDESSSAWTASCLLARELQAAVRLLGGAEAANGLAPPGPGSAGAARGAKRSPRRRDRLRRDPAVRRWSPALRS